MIVRDEALTTYVEPSSGMLAESQKTLRCEHIQATSETIPVAQEPYDFVTMALPCATPGRESQRLCSRRGSF